MFHNAIHSCLKMGLQMFTTQVRACVREWDRVCVCMCVCERERVCTCVYVQKKQRLLKVWPFVLGVINFLLLKYDL
jgi:hypothetical protein